MPDILYESEVEEEMVADLRVNFKDRQRKWLSEPIKVVALPAKRPPPPTPVPPPDAAGSSSVLAVISPIRAETYSAQDRAPDCPALTKEDLDQKDAPSSVRPPS